MRSRFDSVVAIASMAAVGSVFGFLGGVIADTEALSCSHCGDRLLARGRRFCLTAFGAYAADHFLHRPNQYREIVPMTDYQSSDSYASRWEALLTEPSILHKQHVDLLSSFTPR